MSMYQHQPPAAPYPNQGAGGMPPPPQSQYPPPPGATPQGFHGNTMPSGPPLSKVELKISCR